MFINATKIGRVINLSINGKLRKKVCDTVETANDLYRLILDVKANPSDQGLKDILSFLNEKTRVAMQCGLETDPETGEVYLAGFNTPVPMTLVEVAKDYHENGFPMEAIMNFWKLLMLNPDHRVRESLFDFIKTHDFVLTDNGYMVVYKSVYYRAEGEGNHNNKVAEFVSNQYLHVKKDWQTSPRKYMVYIDEDGELNISKTVTVNGWDLETKEVEILGNLAEMYDNLAMLTVADEENAPYTDMHTRTFKIKLGEPVRQDRRDCDADPRNDCSNGLHVGATAYVERFGSYGNTAILVCYVNPAHVVAVPDYDHSKMRVSEYFPFAVANYEDGKIDIVEQSYFESDYTVYEEQELAEMLEKADKGERPVNTAINAKADMRPMDELQKIIENRVIELS